MPNLFDSVNHVVVITGAGFSAPSGMPVYRGSGIGWLDDDLEQKSRSDRYGNHLDELWVHWHNLARQATDAVPNAAHFALTRWQRLLAARDEPGALTIVTQNVDGLHQRAGSTDVIEAHGSILQARRLADGSPTFDFTPANSLVPATPPVSPDGHSRTRPDIVLFGEHPRRMEEASEAVQRADLVIFAGTSGRVWPVAGLLNIANESRARTMLLNEQEWKVGEFDLIVIEDVLALDELVPQDN